MINTLFIDLDGTLLNKDTKLSKINNQALKQAIKQNINVVLVSGRPIGFVKHIASLIDPKVQCIGFNGGYSENLLSFPIDLETRKKLDKIMKKYDLLVMLKTLDHVYSSKVVIGNLIYHVEEDKKIAFDEYVEIDTLLDETVYKYIGQFNEDTLIEEVKQDVEPLHLNFTIYPDRQFEFNHPQANKGDAIRTYCKHHNLNIENCACIGDNDNDISMFKLGAFNIVMANAQSHVKHYAHYVTRHHHEDGVAHVVTKILNNELNLSSCQKMIN